MSSDVTTWCTLFSTPLLTKMSGYNLDYTSLWMSMTRLIFTLLSTITFIRSQPKNLALCCLIDSEWIKLQLFIFADNQLTDRQDDCKRPIGIKHKKVNISWRLRASGIEKSTFTSWYSFFSHAKSRSKVEQRLFCPPSSIELGSKRYLTANGGFEDQVELMVLKTPPEWYTVSAMHGKKNIKS